MEPLHLIEIRGDGSLSEDVSLTDMTRSACEATAGLYQRIGFQRPWVSRRRQRLGMVPTGPVNQRRQDESELFR
jgi:hypothetical protein